MICQVNILWRTSKHYVLLSRTVINGYITIDRIWTFSIDIFVFWPQPGKKLWTPLFILMSNCWKFHKLKRSHFLFRSWKLLFRCCCATKIYSPYKFKQVFYKNPLHPRQFSVGQKTWALWRRRSYLRCVWE